MILTINLKVGEKITVTDPDVSIHEFNKITLASFEQGFLSLCAPYHHIVVPWDNVASVVVTSEINPPVRD